MATDNAPSLIVRPLSRAADIVSRYPKRVLAFAMLAAVLSLVLAAFAMEFKSSRLDLLNPASEFNQRWLVYLDEFGGEEDAIVVVRGGDAAQVTAAMDAVVLELQAAPESFRDILCRVDRETLAPKGLYFLTLEELRQAERFVSNMQPLLYGRWEAITTIGQLQQLNHALLRPIRLPDGQSDAAGEIVEFGERIVRSLDAAFRDDPRFLTLWPNQQAPSAVEGSDYFVADDGRIGFVLLKFNSASRIGINNVRPVKELRESLVRVERQHASVRIGLTGLPILEHDEMQASQRDTTMASVLSLLGVTVLFAAGFGSLRYPLMSVFALILALAWSLAFITLTIGHLNILSVAFGAILIGLGIDFGIHFIARYLHVRPQSADTKAAIRETAASVGPGIVTGGVTTSIAFFTAALSEFTGVAELGWIAGGGVLLCVASALLILPSCLSWLDRSRSVQRHSVRLPLGDWTSRWNASPTRVLMFTLAAMGVLAFGLPRLRYDHNLLNLQPRHLDAVRWEKVLLEETDRSVWFALSMCDSPDELRRRKEAFRSLPTVDRTEDFISLLPTVSPAQQQIIAGIHERLADLPATAPVVPLPAGDAVGALRAELLKTRDNLPPGADSLRGAIDRLLTKLDGVPPSLARQRLYEHQQQLAGDALTRLQSIQKHSQDTPPGLDDFGAPLVDRYVGRSGKHLLKVYAAGDVWDIDSLQAFVDDLEQVDSQITGHPIQTLYASRQMQQSYIDAAIYALIAVVVVLFFDFRSPVTVLLAMLPMGLGMGALFGVLGLLDIPLNPANMIVLPLILGIGIDDGVHVMHDFARSKGRYRIGNATATAIVITSATTMIGFGSLMFAQHQGLRSLGQVLTLGVFFCMLASLFALPALLALRNRTQPLSEDSVRQAA